MRIITETELRDEYKQAEFTSYRLPANARFTPSAQQFLSERRIEVLSDTQREIKDGFFVLSTGEKLSEKPEHMTHLYGKALVPKNHPRIRFRGKLDYLEAQLIDVVLTAELLGYHELAKDLSELLEYTMQIMSAEVKKEPLTPLGFHGLSHLEIREHSHYPDKFYGVAHILPQPKFGKLMARLNIIRTQCRELEVAAMDAFQDQSDGEGRPDLLQSLNRLSSLVYIMMVQLASGHYKVGS